MIFQLSQRERRGKKEEVGLEVDITRNVAALGQPQAGWAWVVWQASRNPRGEDTDVAV
jgi:hypothetical protein